MGEIFCLLFFRKDTYPFKYFRYFQEYFRYRDNIKMIKNDNNLLEIVQNPNLEWISTNKDFERIITPTITIPFILFISYIGYFYHNFTDMTGIMQ